MSDKNVLPVVSMFDLNTSKYEDFKNLSEDDLKLNTLIISIEQLRASRKIAKETERIRNNVIFFFWAAIISTFLLVFVSIISSV